MKIDKTTCFVLLVATGLLATGPAVLYWYCRPAARSASDRYPPVPEYAGPFLNVAASVGYVAEESCALCHEDKARSYALHPMGRSLVSASQGHRPPIDPAHNNPFTALGSRFLVERGDNKESHRRTRLDAAGRPVAELDWSVRYAVGSGFHGHSYFAEFDGYLFQTPVSWYTQKQVWDLSPAFNEHLLRGRPVMPECLFCHVNRANHHEGSVNRYEQPIFDGLAIGCQRCHGPGEAHVARRMQPEPVEQEPDYTIVNPRHLPPSLREAVCEQCHLEGEIRIVRRGRGIYDYRPGMPLEWFWSVFVPSADGDEEQKAVSHVEQMVQSRCYQGSAGPRQLGCASCHDPHKHEAPAERVAHYRQRCLKCHQIDSKDCTLPLPDRLRGNADDSCIACHMPRYGASDVPHTASTDHRIPRVAVTKARGRERPARRDAISIASFYGTRSGIDARENERDMGLALMTMSRGEPGSALRLAQQALPALENAWRRDSDDLAVGEARGLALHLQDRPAEALQVFETILNRAPQREYAIMGAAVAAEALGKTDTSLAYWRRAVAANPWSVDYVRSLVLLLVKSAAWDEARLHCRVWLRLDPFSADARSQWVLCLLASGHKEEARAEFARIEALAPKNLSELQARFHRKLK